MLTAAIALGLIGMLAAIGLGVAAKVFYVEVDPLVAAVEEALPGANCGGCGYAGCSSAAEAIAAGNMAPGQCVASNQEIQEEVAGLMGVELVETEPEIAKVGCRYSLAKADLKFDYSGVDDCRAAAMIGGGPKECPIGCLGLGSCVKACPFDAITIGPEGLPVVIEHKCTGCGTCVKTCPMAIIQLTSVSNRILGEFQETECTAPCQRACPAGIDIPEYIRQAGQGDYAGSLLTIKERNPLPLVCGRICPHPCEANCRRNLSDEPVGINYVKRYVSDYERLSGKPIPLYKAPATGRKTAVTGGGALGLTAAAFLARLGHEATILEAQDKMGGLLRTAIPAERLPREVLDFEIQTILDLGVEARTGQLMGRDFDLKSLFNEGFEAVLLATGGFDANLMLNTKPSPRHGLPGLFHLLPLMLGWQAGEEFDLGAKVALVGGGKTALQAAEMARKGGAEEITILWSRTEAELDLTAEDKKLAEGVKLVYGIKPVKLAGSLEGLTTLTYLDGSGADQVLETGTVVAGAGRIPELIAVPVFEITPAASEEEEETKTLIGWEACRPYGQAGQGQLALFESDRAITDYRAAVEAIGAGRRAAAAIHQALNGESIDGPARMLTPEFNILDVEAINNLQDTGPREIMPESTVAELNDPANEVEKGLSESQVKAEAQRCLNCGLICYARTRYDA